ncbi:MAG: hypothetical protein ACOCWG_01440, partial [bacterium]
RLVAKMPKAITPNYGTYRSLLIRAFNRAGLDLKKKKFNPHSFRHARASELARHLTEHQMDSYFGWVIGSRMAAHYVHMSGKSLDVALRKLNGLKTKEEEDQSKLKPRLCPKCGIANDFEREFCHNCKSPMDIAKAIKFEEQLNQARQKAEQNGQVVKSMLQLPNIREQLINHLGLQSNQ